MIFKKPSGIWQEYQKALQFNESIDLVEKVKNNENFFLGRQWEGVNAPDLDKPVFNILKRVVNYFIAMLVSDDIGCLTEWRTAFHASCCALQSGRFARLWSLTGLARSAAEFCGTRLWTETA